MSPYGKTHPAKRNSAALTDGVDRAPGPRDVEGRRLLRRRSRAGR